MAWSAARAVMAMNVNVGLTQLPEDIAAPSVTKTFGAT